MRKDNENYLEIFDNICGRCCVYGDNVGYFRHLWQNGACSRLSDLADSFFVSGFVLFGAGMLVFLTNGGAFDALAFGFVKLIDSFRKNVRNTKYQTYYDYANEKKSEQRSFLHIVLVGIGFIAVAVVFYFLYQNALQQLQQATALLW